MGCFGSHGWGMGLGWIFGLIIILIAVWLVVKTIKQNNQSVQSQKKSPIDILKERYAKGEINKQEFEERKKDLQ